MSDVSVLTIAAGREEHLRNVVRGLARQTQQPAELVIAVMQDDIYRDLPRTDFPIRQLRMDRNDMPLAGARNRAAAQSKGEKLVFLDVDCIPAPRLVADYAAHLDHGPGLYMGEVLYLPGGAARDGIDYDAFDRIAVRHTDRRGPPEGALDLCEDYRCFWSLNFAMTREDWEAIGGFDERYTGYGGEDTDFGRQVAEAGMPIYWARGARAYHQYHVHFMPPIHHVASVIRNAEFFAEKWGHRTMEHWLHAFVRMGLIENTPQGLRILREPNEDDIALCRQDPDMPFASTRRVLDILDGVDPKVAWRKRHAELEKAQSRLLLPAAE